LRDILYFIFYIGRRTSDIFSSDWSLSVDTSMYNSWALKTISPNQNCNSKSVSILRSFWPHIRAFVSLGGVGSIYCSSDARHYCDRKWSKLLRKLGLQLVRCYQYDPVILILKHTKLDMLSSIYWFRYLLFLLHRCQQIYLRRIFQFLILSDFVKNFVWLMGLNIVVNLFYFYFILRSISDHPWN
jgi:hypothetical protein